jgi:hypothetical protein
MRGGSAFTLLWLIGAIVVIIAVLPLAGIAL